MSDTADAFKAHDLNPQQQQWLAEMRSLFHTIPERMRERIAAYVLYGARVGSFLQAALADEFSNAVCCADDENLAAITGWAKFIHNVIPGQSHGSRAAVAAWIRQSGLSTPAVTQ